MPQRHLSALVALLVVATVPCSGAEPAPDASFPAPECRQRLRELVGDPSSVQTLVVTLPDPVASAFGREFDGYLLGLQQALAAEGYLQDAACLTWRLADLNDPSQQKAAEQAARQQPSLLVYHRARHRRSDEVLVVFVVGERPDAGMHEPALKAALKQASGLRKGAILRILGPTLSGSAQSLARVIGKDRGPRRYMIRSGTATGTEVADTLEGGADVLVDFDSLAATSEEMQDFVWNELVPSRLHLDTRWKRGDCLQDCDNQRVALLVELSPYGGQFAVEAERQGFQVIRVPSHVAAVRAEYQEIARRMQLEAQRKVASTRGVEAMPLDLTAPSLSGVPAFGRTNTLSSVDLVLSQTLRQLARDRIEVVGIVAAGTADKIFLAERVRAFTPDVRMITFEGDVLLTHPDYFPATSGMLVVSSNPLSRPDPFRSPIPQGSATRESRLHFDLDGAQGIYRAARQLLAEDMEHSKHQVYVTIVGRRGLIPITRYPAEAPQIQPGDDSLQGAGAPLQVSFDVRLLPAIWTLLVALLSVGIVLVASRISLDLRDGRCLIGIIPVDLVRPRFWGRPAQDRLLHALVAVFPVAVGTFYLILALPALGPSAATPGTWERWIHVALGLLVTVCILLFVFAALYLLSGLLYRTLLDLGEPQVPPARESFWVCQAKRLSPLLLAILSTGAIAFAGTACLRHLWTTGEALRSQLLAARALSMSSGVSPLIPSLLMMGVVLAWILVALRWRERLRTLDPGRSALSTGDVEAGLLKALQELDALTSGRRSGWLLGLLALVPFVYIAGRQGEWFVVRSIESRQFDLFVTLLLALAVFLTVLTCIALYRGWRSLAEFLEEQAVEAQELPASRRRAPKLGPLRALLVDSKMCTEPAYAELAKLVSRREVLDLPMWSKLVAVPAATPEDRSPLDREIAALRGRGTMYFVRVAFLQIGHLMVLVTLALLGLFFAVNAYPFEPRRLLLVHLGTLVVGAMAVSVTVILQAQGYKQLQDSSGLGKAAFGWRSLAQRLMVTAGLPVVGLAMGRFPELRRLLNDWLEPLITSLK
jgi:hypothetical protein